MGLSPDRQQLLSLCLGSSEYACLIVRGYKTAETKMTAHLKKMCGRYVVLYANQLPRMETLPAKSPGLIDELRRHFPDDSDEIMNSPWPQPCENSDGHAWALGETVTKTCCGMPCTHDWEPPTVEDVSSHFWCTRKHLCVHQIGSSSTQHVYWTRSCFHTRFRKCVQCLVCGYSLYLSQQSRGDA